MRGVFFGVEYDNDPIPHAHVVPGSRSGKFVKWVKEYMPVVIEREDGKKVLRERRCLQLPTGFCLRKDEIKGEMHLHRTHDWQDAKFFVLETHTIGTFIHPVKAKMEKEEKEKNGKFIPTDTGAATAANAGTLDQKPSVARSSDATLPHHITFSWSGD